jgi:hypothetical protein
LSASEGMGHPANADLLMAANSLAGTSKQQQANGYPNVTYTPYQPYSTAVIAGPKSPGNSQASRAHSYSAIDSANNHGLSATKRQLSLQSGPDSGYSASSSRVARHSGSSLTSPLASASPSSSGAIQHTNTSAYAATSLNTPPPYSQGSAKGAGGNNHNIDAHVPVTPGMPDPRAPVFIPSGFGF